MKIPGLIIEKYSDNIQCVFEETRISMSLDHEQFVAFLKTEEGQHLFTKYDEAIAAVVAARYTDKIFDDHQQAALRNQATIIQTNRDLLKAYTAYVHAVHNVYDSMLYWMTKNKVAQSLAVKDLVNIVLYGNLCRLADQVGVLMQNGFPDAALMLWRSFYEYGVITSFLLEKDSAELSQRFKDASFGDTHKKVESFNKRHVDLKFPSLDEGYVQRSTANYESLKEKYGKDFVEKDYAWATGFVSGKPNFREIEETMNFGRYRPFYIWASTRSHPNYYGLTEGFSENEKLILRNIVAQDADKKSMIDPAQLTLSIFERVNKRFFFLYSTPSEYTTNVAVFAALYKQFAAKIADPAKSKK
jgi:hypothetical protein